MVNNWAKTIIMNRGECMGTLSLHVATLTHGREKVLHVVQICHYNFLNMMRSQNQVPQPLKVGVNWRCVWYITPLRVVYSIYYPGSTYFYTFMGDCNWLCYIISPSVCGMIWVCGFVQFAHWLYEPCKHTAFALYPSWYEYTQGLETPVSCLSSPS